MSDSISPEDNQRLTRVGPGTEMGELLRCYWWPVAFSDDLKERPTFIRLLGEDLVLFRGNDGVAGLLGAYCPHRGANLCLGSATSNGLRCRYHGWVISRDGDAVQTPGDPERAVGLKHTAYSVQELGGLIFVYLGKAPAPLLPRFHMLVANGQRNGMIQSFNNSNWLQSAENGLDPFHPSFLHPDVWSILKPLPIHDWTERTAMGCVSKQIRKGRTADEEYYYTDHQMVMPGLVFGGDTSLSYGGAETVSEYPAGSCRWSIPIDDTHTMNFRLYFRPGGEPSPIERRKDAGTALEIEPYKEYKNGERELGYSLPAAIAEQDATVLDSMRAIVPRENEHLYRGDGAIRVYRELLLEQLDAVRAGKDPVGVIRNESENETIVLAGKYYPMTDVQRRAMIADVPDLVTVADITPHFERV